LISFLNLPIAKQVHLVLFIFLFIGTDYKNQLQLISVLCGDIYWPGIRQLKSYNKFQSFLKSDPQFKESVIDYKFYVPNSLAIDLINQLLTLNPKKRINVDDAIRSAFLESQSPSALEAFFSNYPRMIESADKKRMRYEDNNQPAQKMMKFPPLDPVY
jgi:mitogen-activated protein kinase 1/3